MTVNSVRFSLFSSAKDNSPKAQELSLSNFVNLLVGEPELSSAKETGEAWSPARFLPGKTRAKTHVEALGCVAFDFDRGRDGQLGLSQDDADVLFDWIVKHDYLYVAHNTFSSGQVYPREKLRVVLFFNREVTPAEYERVWKALVQELPIKPDTSCSDASRIYFSPRIPAEYKTYYQANTDGNKLVDVNALLGSNGYSLHLNGANNPAKNWSEEQWLEHVSTAVEKEPALNSAAFALGVLAGHKGGDLTTAQGGIWSKCKAALLHNTTSEPVKDWHAAKATCDEAVSAGYFQGTSKKDLAITQKMVDTATAALKKEVKYVGSDPKQLAGAAYRMGRYTPHVLSAELVHKELFKAATQGDGDFLTGVEADAVLDTNLAKGQKNPLYVYEGWKSKLVIDAEKGTVVVCDENAALFLGYHPECEGLLKWNVRRNQPFFQYNPPWLTHRSEFPCPVADRDGVDAGRWLAKQLGRPLVSAERSLIALNTVAACHEYDPFKDWLEALKWDGVSRLGQWLHKTCHVEDNDYHKLVGTKFILSAVARTLTPSCAAPHMLVLVGPQGIGKSRAFRELCGDEYFCSNIGNLEDKDAVINLSKFVIVELPELAAFRKKEMEVIKRFISDTDEDLRKAYGRNSERVMRRAVFGGTTNERHFLQDPTGNRRFWPVECEGKFDIEWLVSNREQLWAEAYVLVSKGEKWWPDTTQEHLCITEQEKYMEEDDIAPALDFFKHPFKGWPTHLLTELHTHLPGQLGEDGRFLWATVQQVHLVAGTNIQSRQDQLRVQKIIIRNKWVKKTVRLTGQAARIVEFGGRKDS